MRTISQRLADELNVNEQQIIKTVELLDEGATVPFIARYRKEVTGSLDDAQLRLLEDRLHYLRELDDRRETVLKAIDEQGKLTPQLKQQILQAETKTTLEDLYLPYKKKRRTKAQIAREAGLEPLADNLLQNPELDPLVIANEYLNTEANIHTAEEALDGARQILMEKFAEQAELLGELREFMWEQGIIVSTVNADKVSEGAKFSDYFDYQEAIKQIPSHRALALFRGRNEGVLSLNLKLTDEDAFDIHPCESTIAKYFSIQSQGRAADKWLMESVRWAWKIKLFSHIDIELKMRVKEVAEALAIEVFAENLKDLLLAAPAGAKTTLGLDPGIRTGVKVALVDATGKLLATDTIYPHAPKNQWQQSQAVLAKLCHLYNVELISIGNGTASRETEKLVKELLKASPDLSVQSIMVSEAGASVYSASEFASREFPELDVSLRGAVSIARRLQDPLAELVKIEPKAIGVGQYQHDVSQVMLSRKLNAVVEDCVNAVGVDVNMASVPLLQQVAGLSQTLAENIVHYRDAYGAFNNRDELMNVPRMGPKAYEQAAGFLRIINGNNPLDNSAVHPEAYPLVQKIVDTTQRDIRSLIGDDAFLRKLEPSVFTDEQFGLPTVKDILQELSKPGRDPRPEFKSATFQEGVDDIKDLKTDMLLEGVVTNVTNFGAFVDIGVHQDGLVHISMLADKFVKDPREVVKTGDVVKVKVVEVDLPRRRIALSMRLHEQSDAAKVSVGENKQKPAFVKSASQRQPRKAERAQPAANSAMADAFKQALKR